MAGEILVVAEHAQGKLREASKQAMTVAARLAAQRGVAAVGLIGGPGSAEAAAALGRFGAARVVTLDAVPAEPAAWAGALAEVIRPLAPAAVLLAHTLRGKDLGPRLAALLDAPIASDCISVTEEGGVLLGRRPVYAGKALVTVASNSKIFVVTLRPNAVTAEERPAAALMQPSSVTAAPAPTLGAVLKEVLAAAQRKLELTEASIVVSGGRGLKGPENFAMIEELAAALGAAVGASRAVVDAGWRPHGDQVGQTGKTVSPQLYIAVAISGAIQHLAGMRTSRFIVAINKDPEAPIFKVADYGIVGDAFEIVPKLTAAVQALKAAG
ncbi:MAG: electron transfer flavoprotein subunit alpha/FixB family protein [Planctomycetota bacterium]